MAGTAVPVIVTDEEGKPVHNANVRAMRYDLIQNAPVPAATPVDVNTPTNMDGVADFSFRSAQRPGGVAITKKEWFEEVEASGVAMDGTILWKIRLREMIDKRRIEE